MDQFPVESTTVSHQGMLPKSLSVIRCDHDQRVFSQASLSESRHQASKTVVGVFNAVIVTVNIRNLRPCRFWIRMRPAVRVVNIEIIQEREKGALRVAVNPAQDLLVYRIGMFANSERSAVTP